MNIEAPCLLAGCQRQDACDGTRCFQKPAPCESPMTIEEAEKMLAEIGGNDPSDIELQARVSLLFGTRL